MCEPTTLAAISLAVTVAGTATAVVGQQRAASAQAQQIAIEQEDLKTQQQVIAQDKVAETDQEAQRQLLLSEEGARQRGEIRTAQAGLGQLVDSGSAADITADLAGEVEFKKRISQRESDLRQRNFDIRANSLTLQGAATAARGQAQQTASKFKTGSTILSGASTAATKFKFGGDKGISFRT